MHPAILAMALGAELVIQISGHLPDLNADRTCKSRIAGDKLMGMKPDQTYDECVSNEKLAQQQLGQIWSSHSASIRAQCTSEANELGVRTYVDLLACLQIKDDVTPNSGSSPKRTIQNKPAN